MKLLIVKTSSLGDVVHTLPAVTDACSFCDDLTIDWVVEEAFAEIPKFHPGVTNVIPVALRRWRRNWSGAIRSGEIADFSSTLRRESYDLVIDAQGLIKSALITRLARGTRAGYDRSSSREGLASLFYDCVVGVNPNQHAIERTRQLFAELLDYSVPQTVEFGLVAGAPVGEQAASVMLLHGTTWPSKHWPEEYWRAIATLAEQDGFQVLIPAGNEDERLRAHRIASPSAKVLTSMTLGELALQLSSCAGVLTVDTGLGHLAAALGVPVAALYGPTDPSLTGIRGPFQEIIVSDHLPCIPCRKRNCKFDEYSSKIYPPCFSKTTPEGTWKALRSQINSESRT